MRFIYLDGRQKEVAVTKREYRWELPELLPKLRSDDEAKVVRHIFEVRAYKNKDKTLYLYAELGLDEEKSLKVANKLLNTPITNIDVAKFRACLPACTDRLIRELGAKLAGDYETLQEEHRIVVDRIKASAARIKEPRTGWNIENVMAAQMAFARDVEFFGNLL